MYEDTYCPHTFWPDVTPEIVGWFRYENVTSLLPRPWPPWYSPKRDLDGLKYRVFCLEHQTSEFTPLTPKLEARPRASASVSYHMILESFPPVPRAAGAANVLRWTTESLWKSHFWYFSGHFSFKSGHFFLVSRGAYTLHNWYSLGTLSKDKD